MPAAARLTDMHICPLADPIPHVGGPIIGPGCTTVLIENQPAARISDLAVCIPAIDVIAMGSPTVIIGGMPSARLGDPTIHGGVIVTGAATVVVGIPWQAPALMAAARDAAPFCQLDNLPMPPVPAAAPPQAEALQQAAEDGAPLCAMAPTPGPAALSQAQAAAASQGKTAAGAHAAAQAPAAAAAAQSPAAAAAQSPAAAAQSPAAAAARTGAHKL